MFFFVLGFIFYVGFFVFCFYLEFGRRGCWFFGFLVVMRFSKDVFWEGGELLVLLVF